MNDEQFGKMVRVLAAHGFAVIPMAGAQSLLAPGKPATAAAPKSATTADGRKAYTCGTCGQTGHNVRACPTTTAAAPAPAAPAPKARAAAPAVQAPAPSVGLDDLSFDLSDLGGAPAAAPPVQRKAAAPAPAAAPARPAPKAAAPVQAAPAPEAEAADEDVSSFLDDLDDLLPG